MKTITVTGLQIQFDSYDEGADKHNALNMLDEINEVLQQRFPDKSPIIFVNGIDDSQIAIEEADEEKRACMEAGTHLQSCDDDGFCNECGNQ